MERKFPKIRKIAVLGSTGSIGTQTLEIIRHYPERLRAIVLTACSNWQLLAAQARELKPKMVVISDSRHFASLRDALRDTDVEVKAGEQALVEAASLPEVDIVVGALVGYSGLPSTIAALEAGKSLALANKETLVVGGALIESIIKRKGKRILPVDSEHSAIFQCIYGEAPQSVNKLILTASGGPFRNFTEDQLKNVSVKQALSHPNWSMGAKVTIDSATMMNKGFEMIEARWIFSMHPDDISIVVHPESIVHSMVEFVDGSVKAQLGLPDMRLPIEVALAYPDRLDLSSRLQMPHLNLAAIGSLSFEEPDMRMFPLLKLAYDVAKADALAPAVMNAANEVAVQAFLKGQIRFIDISKLVIDSVDKAAPLFAGEPLSLESIAEAHKEGTLIALSKI